MMTQIKEIIHLYLGCEAAIGYNPCEISGMRIDIIDAVSLKGIFTSNGDFEKFENVKPILRRLDSMTEEEAEEFALMCMNPPDGFHPEAHRIEKDQIQIELVPNDGGNNLDADVELYIGVSAICWEGSICIMKDGRIGKLEEDEDTDKMKPIEGIAVKIAYLLKQGFDLFGLIDSGQAFDYETKTCKS